MIIKQAIPPMPSSSTPVNAPAEVVMPDCCNIGVVFRSLLAVNIVVLTAILVQSGSVFQGLQEFVEASMVVELACLWSLFSLCVLRRMLLRFGRMDAISLWGQRIFCALVPAAVTAVVVRFLTSFVWF